MAELREWLQARGLGRYADALLAQDIELDILPQLTDADLTAAGLPVGARKRLLQAIEGLRNLSDAAMQSVGPPPIAPTVEPATEAERRQLTVLFCDVVGSTHLAETLDAEDLRNLLLSFQKVCAEVVQRHEGQIGLFIGDGVTAYFGYPRAHEDSAQSAVQAGLDIMAGLTELAMVSKPAAVSTLARLLSVNWALARSAFVTASLAKRQILPHVCKAWHRRVASS